MTEILSDPTAASVGPWPPPAPEPVEPGGVWLTDDQWDIDRQAMALREHPRIMAAREAGVAQLKKSMQYAVTDGPCTLTDAMDNLVFAMLQAAVNDDPTRPRVVWSERLPYTAAGVAVPGCRYAADTPDRVYRGVGVSPNYRYEITGRRHPTHPSDHDFSVEATPFPAMWGSSMAAVQAPAGIDLAADGTWRVIADSTPTDERRNHLHLPPGTRGLLVRDTLHDWGSQVPSEVSVRVLDADPAPPRTPDEIATLGAEMLDRAIELSLGLFEGSFNQPVNQLHAFYRGVNWGVPGGVIAYNRFDLAEDEALIITLDLITGRYLGINLSSPWMDSLPCDARTSCLNDRQVQADDDGTITFVVSPTDPRVHNWLDTAGLRSGVMWARWERFDEPPTVHYQVDEAARAARWAKRPWSYEQNTVENAVREVRVVKLDELPAAVPAGQDRVTPEQRRELVNRRVAAYRVRVTGRPVQ